eukprot:CAMPEP_0204869886 /NCGR_PEP_ID=MMETSP1348-20121228/30957_1 /ASSEMBLY_ACC=CAM_ASM_000700 /TAXON_ID=215587 /ORGANISM="Aplanochytrium stocchinoi, Strain GSBS06" /LENGTH=1097 /DNA_ID=CAMNT_0052023417 /DNA_START=77 /DNA_END=3371 /DNA_ORIENTATION=-
MDGLRRRSSRLVPRKSVVGGKKGNKTKKSTRTSTVRQANAKLSQSQKLDDDVPPMPSPEEIEKRYGKILESMALPKKNQEALWKQDDATKWRLILAHESFAQGGGGNHEQKTKPEYWVNFMSQRNGSGAPVINVESANELQTVLRTAHRDFLISFIEQDGITALNDLTWHFSTIIDKNNQEKDIIASLVAAYTVLMNNNVGMEGALIVKGTITAIAMAMDYVDGVDPMTTTEQVVLLLSVVCWYSEEGRAQVVGAIKDIRLRRREANRYQTLVYMLEHTTSTSFKASIATFITTVCNAASKLEDRVPVRNDFLTLDIINVFNRVLKHAKESTSEEEEEHYAQIQKQYEVFASIMNADHKEVVRKMIKSSSEDDEFMDLSNPKEVWNVVEKNSRKAEAPDLLLKITQALLMIPVEKTIAKPIYNSIIKYIYEATSFERVTADGKKKVRKSLTAEPPLNYASLGELFDSKLELDARVSQLASSDEIIDKQREKLKAMAAQIQELKKNVGVGVPQAAEQQEAVKILKEKNENLLKTIADMEKELAEAKKGGGNGGKNKDDNNLKDSLIQDYKGKLDETGLVPAGICPGKTAKDPPPVPKPGMPGSLENAPVAVVEKKPANGEGGLAAMLAGKQAKIAAKPKDNKAEKAKAALQKLGLPDKKPIKPNVKMTHVFWSVIPPDQLEGTIWPELSDQSVKFDIKHFEESFGKKAAKKLARTTTAAPGTMTKHVEVVHLIDSQRQQNLGIALKRMRLKNKEIKSAVITMDDTVLSPATVNVLVDICPTAEEKQLLDKYIKDGSDPKVLGPEEKYLYEVSQIPRLQERLQCLRTKHEFGYHARKILDITKLTRNAVVEVEKSEPFKRILEIILALGNYANGGTPRGAAWGFKLDVLGKLANVKDNTGHTTMMHYLYHLLEDQYPELLKKFHLPAASKVTQLSLTDVSGDLNALSKAVQQIKSEIQHPPFTKGDRFQKVMEKFEVRASKDVVRLQTDFESVRSDFQKLAIRFGESGPQVQPSSFFSSLVTFEHDLKRVAKQVAKMREDAERKDKAEKEKLRRQTLRKLKKLQQSTGDPDLFDAYKKANSGDTAEVIERFIDGIKLKK